MPSQFKRRHRAISEPLERRVLLTSATDTAIEKFNLSPALFVENDGQWTDSSVHFVHQGKGASIAMTDRGPVFELYKDDSVKSGLSGGTGVPPVIDPKEQMEEHGRDGRATGNATGADTTEIESTRFAVSFNNANITQPIGHDQSSSTFNYNIGTPDLHRSNVHGFAKIVYPNLYEGIDLHTWGQRDSLKYEFHVAPNIDYRQIAVQYEGVEDLWIDDRGRLHAELGSGFGEVIDDAPVIWQEVKGKRVDVAGRFKLLDGDAYTFELTGKFDPKLPLVIDPDLAWSSYLGGDMYDVAVGISIDTDGNIWVTGTTLSQGWAVGGFDTSLDGEQDGYIAKINSDGTLEWTSYLGGSSSDWGLDISLDAGGNAWVIGTTASPGWTSGGFDTSYNGGTHDAFVAKFNADGTLAWSSFIGGSAKEYGNNLSVDADGNAWVTGETTSSGWTVGGFDTSSNGAMDGFVAKINANGTLAWSSYVGGSQNDRVIGIAIDDDGNAWMTGSTSSSGWTVGGFDTSHNGNEDGFVAKMNANGALAWSGYIGGSSSDNAYGISMDTDGNAWVIGTTSSSGWTVGGFDISYNGGSDAYVAKINANGTLAWSSYLGGQGEDVGHGISRDANGHTWVTGYTGSPGWTVGGFDTDYNGGVGDAFVARINADGILVSSSYLGGSNRDDGRTISVDVHRNVWVAGFTWSSGWTVGGFDTSFNGGIGDAFIAKITVPVDVDVPVFDIAVCNYLAVSQQTVMVSFNENVSGSLAATDFVLTNLNTNTAVALTLQSISADGKSATFTFSATGNDLGHAILTDGHYRIRALAGEIEDEAGNALASDVDHFFDFKNADFALADRVVDFNDLLIIAQNYNTGPGKLFSQGDANYDGYVNFNDLLAVAQRYNTGIPSLRIGQFAPITKAKPRTIIGDVFGSQTRIF